MMYKSEIKLEKNNLDADKRKELQRQVNILISTFYHGKYLLILIVVISIIANICYIYLTKKYT